MHTYCAPPYWARALLGAQETRAAGAIGRTGSTLPKLPTIAGELAGAIRRGKADGRLGPEHRLDIVRARFLVDSWPTR